MKEVNWSATARSPSSTNLIDWEADLIAERLQKLAAGCGGGEEGEVGQRHALERHVHAHFGLMSLWCSSDFANGEELQPKEMRTVPNQRNLRWGSWIAGGFDGFRWVAMDCGGLRGFAGNCGILNGLSLPEFRRRSKKFEELGRIYRKFTTNLQVTYCRLLLDDADDCRRLLDAAGGFWLLQTIAGLQFENRTDCRKFGDEFVWKFDDSSVAATTWASQLETTKTIWRTRRIPSD